MAKVQLKICCGMNCMSRGGQELFDLVEHDERIMNLCEIDCTTCLDGCGGDGSHSPVVEINGKRYIEMTSERLLELIDEAAKT